MSDDDQAWSARFSWLAFAFAVALVLWCAVKLGVSAIGAVRELAQ